MANKHSNVETRTVQRIAFNVAGQRASTWNASGNLVTENYYADGQAVAYYSSTDGYIHFQHQDWEGTVRVRTKYNAAVDGTFLSYPFGDGFTESGSDSDPLHYALLDHDADSYTEHATFRQYSSTQGRWLAPDPFGGSYDAGNPQSLNRYVYVLNNPLSFIDPLGLNSVAAGCIDADGSRTSDTPASSCEGGEDSGETGVSQVVPDCTGPGCPHDPAPPPPPPAPAPDPGDCGFGCRRYPGGGGDNTGVGGAGAGPGGRTGAAPQPGNSATPFQVGAQWLTGTGPRNQTFHDGDPFTEQLRHHDNVQDVINGVRDGSLPPNGNHDYNLGGVKGVGLYLRDYSTLLTGGLTGNLAVTYLGSYSLHYATSDGVITFTVKNTSSLGSATHLPIFGYTAAGQSFSRFMTGLAQGGPMSPTTQTFIFHEHVIP